MIKDTKGLAFTIMGGRPSDPGWEEVHVGAASKIEASRPLLDCKDEDMDHRRGAFIAVTKGFRYSNGMTVSSCRFLTALADSFRPETGQHQFKRHQQGCYG